MFIGTNPRQSEYPPAIANIRNFRADLTDALTIIAPSPDVEVTKSPAHAQDWIKRTLSLDTP